MNRPVRLLLVGLVGAVLASALGGAHASGRDHPMPAAKAVLVQSPQLIDPALVNTGPRRPYVAASPDSGNPQLIDEVKAAAVSLISESYSAGAMPADLRARHEYIAGQLGRDLRAAAITRVWAPDKAAAEAAVLERGMATFDNDTTSKGISKIDFIVTSWQHVEVDGDWASLAVTGYLRQFHEDGNYHDDQALQSQIQLARSSASELHSGWRLDQLVKVGLPEDVSP